MYEVVKVVCEAMDKLMAQLVPKEQSLEAMCDVADKLSRDLTKLIEKREKSLK